MWVNVSLKCPEFGEWFALTRVADDGSVLPIAYVSRLDVEKLNDGSANFDLLDAPRDVDVQQRGLFPSTGRDDD